VTLGRRQFITLGTATLLVSLFACSAGVAHRIPTTPPPGVAAPRVDADVRACEKAAPPGITYRDWTYGSCMIARGYTAYVHVPIWTPPAAGKNFVGYTATPTRRHTPAQVFSDISACAGKTEREARADPRLTVFTWPNSPIDFDAVDRVFGGCMSGRGYAVKLWRP